MNNQGTEVHVEPITWRSIINYAVIAGAGYFAGRGTISADDAEVITGALIGLGSVVLRLLAKKRGIKITKPNPL